MFIYIDESGSFVSAPKMGAWNVVAAVDVPEASRRSVEEAVRVLKVSSGTHMFAELKINEISEASYLSFLAALAKTHALLFATATDAGGNQVDSVTKHQASQVAKILENLPVMKYEGGRQGVQMLADQVGSIPPQLYVQLACQVDLLHAVVTRAINYFAQRVPATLSARV